MAPLGGTREGGMNCNGHGCSVPGGARAFTLIELLVVIAIWNPACLWIENARPLNDFSLERRMKDQLTLGYRYVYFQMRVYW